MNWHVWEQWVPRLESYWPTFSAPYRHTLVDVISAHTSKGGRVAEFGCSVGINLYLLQQKRPDIELIGIDVNAQCRFLTEQLVNPVATFMTLKGLEGGVDTVFTCYTMAYIEEFGLDEHLAIFRERANVVILAEPHHDSPMTMKGGPCPCEARPYNKILDTMGFKVDTVKVKGPNDLDMITIGVK